MRGSVRRSMCAAMLALQAVVLFLSGVVLIGLTELGAAASLGIGGGLAAACILTAGLLRRPWAYVLGWTIQAATLALGFVVPAMVLLGVIFTSLWAGAYFLGAKIDREKAEREVLEQDWAREHGGPATP